VGPLLDDVPADTTRLRVKSADGGPFPALADALEAFVDVESERRDRWGKPRPGRRR